MNNKGPVWKLNQGQINAAAWVNNVKTASGAEMEQLRVTIERRYPDKDGNWQSTNSYGLRELLELRHFLGSVIDKAVDHRKQQRSQGEAA